MINNLVALDHQIPFWTMPSISNRAGETELSLPDILIHCPATGGSVPTGLDTETVIFDSLLSIGLPLNAHVVEQHIIGDRQTHGSSARSKGETEMHNVYRAHTFFAVTALGFASLVAIEMMISR